MFNTYKTQYKQLIKLGTPVLLSQIGIFSVQIFDNAMVGSLGALPLAAVSFSGAVFLIMFLFITGLSMSITPLVGEAFIQEKKKTVAIYLVNAFFLYTGVSMLAMLLQLGLIPLLYYLGQPVEVVEASIPYYRYLVWSIIPYMMFCTFERFWEGLGKTKVNMAIIITANVINIGLNWVFIFGNWGFPCMGATGAGLATLISRVCMVLFAVIWFVVIPHYRSYLTYFSKRNIRRSYMEKLLKIGLPISLQTATEGASGTITGIMVGWFGTAAIAAHQITMIVAGIVFMFALGLGSATTIQISYEFGKKDFTRLRKVSAAALHLITGWSIFAGSLFVLFRNDIIRLFTDDPVVIAIAFLLFATYALNLIFDGLQIVMVGQLRGIQDVTRLMPISLLCYIGIHVPLGYFLAFVLNMGVSGLYISFGVGLITAFILLRKIFVSQIKKMEICKTSPI